MNGSMMQQPLLIFSLLTHAAFAMRRARAAMSR